MTRQRAPWKGREWSPRRRAEGYAQAWGADDILLVLCSWKISRIRGCSQLASTWH